MAKKPLTVSQKLRQAIEQSGESRYALWKRSGISESVLSKFIAGGGLDLETVDRLAEALGLKLIETAKDE